MTLAVPDVAALKRALKMAVAASAAWWISTLLGAPLPVFAAIVPFVAIRKDDPYSAINVSAGRILGVFVGVLLGLGLLRLSDDVTVWLAVATIVASSALAMVMRVDGEPNVQIAVSALIMLFLADRAGSTGIDRIWETGVGAIVTAVVATLMWPPNPVASAREKLGRMREQLCEDLHAAVELIARPRAAEDLLEAVRANQLSARDTALDLPRAERALRWNLLHRSDGPALERLTARIVLLARIHRHVRSMVRSIADSSDDAIFDCRAGLTSLESAAAAVADALAPRLKGEAVRQSLDSATAALDELATASTGRLATVLEIFMRRIVSDLRTARVEGEPLRG